jgi:hypothetical protein
MQQKLDHFLAAQNIETQIANLSLSFRTTTTDF